MKAVRAREGVGRERVGIGRVVHEILSLLHDEAMRRERIRSDARVGLGADSPRAPHFGLSDLAAHRIELALEPLELEADASVLSRDRGVGERALRFLPQPQRECARLRRDGASIRLRHGYASELRREVLHRR